MGEASRLRPVAVYGQVLACERLADEPRQHHSVGAGLAWAGRVEEAGDGDLSIAFGVKGESQRLPECLRGRVGPARQLGGPKMAISVFGERALAVLTIDLRG